MRSLRSPLVTLAFAIAFTLLPAAITRAQELGDVLGVTHIDGQYYFGTEDYLNQGAEQVLASGTLCIKLQMDHLYASTYQWNSTWPSVGNLRALAQTTYFQNVFAKAFHTFVITTYAFTAAGSGQDPAQYWVNGVTSAQASRETQEFHDLAAYLMATYKGSGKTFILENWEGDWALKGTNRDTQPSTTTVNGMITWVNARQQGIINARNENAALASPSDVQVYGALEVNAVQDAINGDVYQDGVGLHTGWATVTNDVLPFTHVDFASYSAYDTQQHTASSGTSPHIVASFASAVSYLAAHLPTTAHNGQNTGSVYVGEYGLAEDTAGAAAVNSMMNNVIDTVMNDGMPLAMYWEVYSNEVKNKTTTPPPVNGNNAAVNGFWLVKPDGSPGTPWHQYRLNCIASSATHGTTAQIIANATLKYTSAFPSSGSTLGTGWSHNTSTPFNWTCAAGNLVNLNITTASSSYPTGLATLNVTTVAGRPLQPGDYVQFTLKRLNGSGGIGVSLFNDNHGSGFASGAQPFNAWSTVANAWLPVSFAADGSHPAIDWSATNTLGVRLDSADGDFATASFYVNGNYIGSNIYMTSSTTLNTIALYGQNNLVSSFQFGAVKVYFGN